MPLKILRHVLLYLHCDLVTMKVFESLFLLFLLAHANPGVSDQNIAAMSSFHWVRGQNKLGPMLRQNTMLQKTLDKTSVNNSDTGGRPHLFGESLRLLNNTPFWLIPLWCSNLEMNPQFGCSHHEGVEDVVPISNPAHC